MTQDIRRELISQNLGIKPILHGQVYTFQIAIPDSRKVQLSLEQRQAIEHSLLTHQSNLISLILRRTNAYDDDDIDYELVYGAAWLQLAQNLKLEKVWAWVFDMTEEQAIALIAEMDRLMGISSPMAQDSQTPSTDSSLEAFGDRIGMMDQKFQAFADSIRHSMLSSLHEIREEFNEKLKIIHYKLESLNQSDHAQATLELLLEKLDTLTQTQLPRTRSPKGFPPIDHPINLLSASDRDIESALKSVSTAKDQITAAIQAVRYWQQSEQGLSWKNLERSAKARPGVDYKITGFGEGTYERLRTVAEISRNSDVDKQQDFV